MPAAAVIPAPIAYIKVVAVKKLVVEFRDWRIGRASRGMNRCSQFLTFWRTAMSLIGCRGEPGPLL